MKIRNQLTTAIQLSDLLRDAAEQYQAGIKDITLTPNGTSGDTVEIPDTMAQESVSLQTSLTNGDIKITGVDNKLGGSLVPGLQTFTKATPVLTWTRGGSVLFSGQITLDGGGLFVVNFSGGVDAAGVLANGNLDVTLAAAADYVVLVTQEGGAPTIIPRVSAKTTTSFTITGDAAAVVSAFAFRVK